MTEGRARARAASPFVLLLREVSNAAALRTFGPITATIPDAAPAFNGGVFVVVVVAEVVVVVSEVVVLVNVVLETLLVVDVAVVVVNVTVVVLVLVTVVVVLVTVDVQVPHSTGQWCRAYTPNSSSSMQSVSGTRVPHTCSSWKSSHAPGT